MIGVTEKTDIPTGRFAQSSSHPEWVNRLIMLIKVANCTAELKILKQNLGSVTQRFVSVSTIQRHQQQNGISARCLYLRLPLTVNRWHMKLQWCIECRNALNADE
ncbi:hypothetical protein TNCV_4305321 [Trichonephila clavipes]|nr:hypothetical protein TNCV_4305321 [Trichonephila clavipes]